MGYSSENVLPEETRVTDVLEFIELLGFAKELTFRDEAGTLHHFFRYFEEREYRSWTGVELTVSNSSLGMVVVSTRSAAGRSYYDLSVQNWAIRAMKKRFGGSFRSSEGSGRYLRPRARPPSPPASGCYLAYTRFLVNLAQLEASLTRQPYTKLWCSEQGREYLPQHADLIFATNLLLSYLVSIMEDYFKSTFVALLRFSPRKAIVLGQERLGGVELAKVADGEVSVERAYSEQQSFQSIRSVINNFKTLEPRLKLEKELARPFRRRRQTLVESLANLVSERHAFIHTAVVREKVDETFLRKATVDVEEVVWRCYSALLALYRWPDYLRVARGRRFLGYRKKSTADIASGPRSLRD